MSKCKFQDELARHVEEPFLPHLVPELELKKKKDKDDSEAAPAATASSVALKRNAPTNMVSIGVFPLPQYQRILAHLRWKAGSLKCDHTVAGVASSQGKVWEVDSQAEEEV